MALNFGFLAGELPRNFSDGLVDGGKEIFALSVGMHFDVTPPQVHIDPFGCFLYGESEFSAHRLHFKLFQFADVVGDVSDQFFGVLQMTKFEVYTHKILIGSVMKELIGVGIFSN